MAQPQILLAYGERGFSKKLKEALEKGGSRVALLPDGDPPKARYDLIFQLARDPAHVAEGTRLLLDKAKKDRSRLLFVSWRMDAKLYEEAARFARTLLEESSRKGEAEIALLNLGRIYGPGIAPAESGSLGHLITEFAQGNLLTLYEEGKDEDYYLFLEDALEGLTLALEHAQSGETYALAPGIPVTSKSAAELLLELGGKRHEIVFHRGLSASAEKGKVEGESLPEFKIKTSFHDGILAILKEQSSALTDRPASARRWPRFRLPHPSRRGLRRAGIILLILSPLLYLAGEAGFSYYQLNRAKSAFLSLDFPRAQAASATASSSLGRLSKIFPAVRFLVEISQSNQEIAAQGTVLTQTLENLVKSRRGEETAPQGPQDFQAAQAAFFSAEQHLTLAWLEIQQIETKFLQDMTGELQELVGRGIEITRMAASFLGQAEELLGYKGERSYLIFFQNSAELWPGGGFVGALANLTLENGRIKNLVFYDAYDFAQYKTADGIWARNINLNPDFSYNAKSFAEVFARATSVKIDGTIGLDLRFAQKLIEITGPIELPDFKTEVTAQSFFEVTTSEVEKDFFPGSTKKKRFLQALGEGIMAKLFAIDQSGYAKVANLGWEQLRTKGILLYFANPEFNRAVTEGSFGGQVEEAEGDYLFALSHNTGTKGTVWVTRELAYRVFNSDREGTLRGELSVTWRNNGLESWPAGTYEDLFRILVPEGSQLVKAELEKEDITTGIRPRGEHGKTSFEYRVRIDSDTAKTLVLTYDLPKSLNLGNLSLYRLLVQKQAGAYGDRLRFIFERPLNYEIRGTARTNGEGDLQKDGDNLIFEGSLEKDLNFEVGIKER